MGGRKRVQAAAEAEPEVEAGAEVSAEVGAAEVSAEDGAGAEAEAPAWVQTKAPPKAPTRASTTKTPIKLRGKKRVRAPPVKKRVRAPPVMPSPAEALRALTDELTVTVDDAAVLLKLSRHYAYAMVKEGSIPSIRLGRVIRVPSAALRTMLQLEAREAAE